MTSSKEKSNPQEIFKIEAIAADSATFDDDKRRPSFVSKATTKINVFKSSSSYLQVQDYHSNLNHTHEYEEIEKIETLKASNFSRFSQNAELFLNEPLVEGSALIHSSSEKNLEKVSEDLVFVNLNRLEDVETKSCKNVKVEPLQNLNQRSGSMQWIQNAFQNVGQRFLDLRRPSDIVADHMRKSNEEIEMDQDQYCVLSELQHDVARFTGRRFSENVVGKQKKLLFSTGFGNLKGLWKDRQAANKRQQEDDFDRTRPDVCPLFNFPKKGDEDEIILDALRQAMRKCTIDNPDSRPTSDSVLLQLSQLLD
ncbi:uncharacterized protein LOC129217676 [Uloborus diversus]|uniref:uncharacterized protein LOC129217676 n=1 Tax=Uloborus diversus TaxID=327109 RepID=UPI002409080E|nr:uncharacterized protein LOC129217676 [Uloborus diversus]